MRHSRLYSIEDRQLYVEIIDSTGPCIDRSGITNDEPLSIEMEAVINSDEGRAACVAAASSGLPSLAGVEPLIVAALGVRYSERYMATVQAGYQVGTLMKALGYHITRQGKMPEDSVAKTAACWQRNR